MEQCQRDAVRAHEARAVVVHRERLQRRAAVAAITFLHPGGRLRDLLVAGPVRIRPICP